MLVETGRKFVTLKTLFALVLGAALSGPATALSQALPPGRLKVSEIKKNGKPVTVIRLTGSIAYPMARELADILKEMPAENRHILLHLDSGGGSVQEGLQIIGLLRGKRNDGFRVDTTVHNGDSCGSMCVPVFAQGDNRYAGAVAAFMFHGVVKHGFTNVPDEERTRSLLNLFLDRGVTQAWLDSMWERKVFNTPGAYWMTGAQLVSEDSGMVTSLLPAHDVEAPWSAPIDPSIRPR